MRRINACTAAAIWALVLVLLEARQAGAFCLLGTTKGSLTTRQPVNRSFRRAWADDSSFSDREDDEEDDVPRPSVSSTSPFALANSFEVFLNQCTIQSFVFLLKSLRDPQTVRWIEDFTQPSIPDDSHSKSPKDSSSSSTSSSKLLHYHGLGAMNTTRFPDTWESYFTKLLEQPPQILVIQAHLDHLPVPEYELEIKPASLCTRLISVREQIAREFAKDLTVIGSMGRDALERYYHQQQGLDNLLPQVPASDKKIRQSLVFLELDAEDEDSDAKPSPLRKGNFDLLALLATQESILRILASLDNDDDEASLAERATVQFLEQFYLHRFKTHFTGAQRYGRADDFLQQLLSTLPSTVHVPPSGGSGSGTMLVDPVRVAERIVLERQAVCDEWRRLADEVPVAHTNVRRLQLNLLLGVTTPPPAPATTVESQVSRPSNPLDGSYGEYE